jgi:transcriptional regulator with XRE-family HTH domain
MATKAKQPNPIDIEVGRRIRLRRTALGMSQTQLGDELGITFQQVQKYEKGVNRVGASRLVRIAEVLKTSVQFLTNQTADREEPWVSELLVQPYAMDLLKAYTSIKDKKVRASLLRLVDEIVEQEREAA